MKKQQAVGVLTIAIDTGVELASQFVHALEAELSRRYHARRYRVTGVALPPPAQMHELAQGVLEARQRAGQVFSAVAGCSIGIGFTPACYDWQGIRWDLCLVAAADGTGPMCGSIALPGNLVTEAQYLAMFQSVQSTALATPPERALVKPGARTSRKRFDLALGLVGVLAKQRTGQPLPFQ